ncbi:MAG: pyridoxal 5'-phosphate synthase glutaminase subunit PdxT [candidate division Zixibacteria bacterium]|nr:pyridoxal 5'-phosphate synthase glutaminase subunit PdxT [candidate division Zixibacteria bacterium]
MKEFKETRIGVLALQGDFERHCHQLGLLGVESAPVSLPGDLERIDGLIIPGGESTTMDHLIDRFDLRRPLLSYGRSRPIWGTCAGMIMLAGRVEDNQSGVEPLGLMDIDIVRTGYGRQVFSFEDTLRVDLGEGEIDLPATFIRAPRITRLGRTVSCLATYRGTPVLVSQRNLLASSFHTELEDDTRLLKYFLREFVLP